MGGHFTQHIEQQLISAIGPEGTLPRTIPQESWGTGKTMIKVKRVYDLPSQDDGERFLVERLWPRGVTREAAHLTAWLKDLAPSPALRQWFGHDPKRWAEFQKRYEKELQMLEKQAMLRQLADKARQGTVTLVFAAWDTEHNSAVALKHFIERRHLRSAK